MNKTLRAAIAAAIATLGFPAGTSLAQTAVYQDAGAYLAARSASQTQDYLSAARYFSRALDRDPDNPLLLDSALAAYVGLGTFEAGAPLANRLSDLGVESQLSWLTRQVVAAQSGEWSVIRARIDAGEEIGPLIDGLARAWSLVGDGDMTAALAEFDAVTEGQGLRAFGLYHKALALASVGDLEGAEALLSLPPTQGMQRTRRSTIAQIEVLSRMGRNEDALALIDAVFGAEAPERFEALRAPLRAGEVLPFTVAPTARDGMAEAYLSVAGALDGETADAYTLIYAQAALALRGTDADTIVLTADLLDRVEQYQMAEATYRMIDQTDPDFANAEIGRSESLRKDGRIEAATEVLQALARSHPDMPRVHLNLGNVLREAGDLPGADIAYSDALEKSPSGDAMIWLTHYLRGIVRHQLDIWDEAEADFRTALALNPDHPQILNYLGYSLVERGEKLNEAFAMIEKAVAQQPDNGAIVDSLGWVLFRSGNYAEAVGHLERAAALEPMEAVINDHLGDAYWAVGRVTEARFQWNRALSLDPTEEEATRIRQKLDLGLDEVLAREGVPPLVQVAEDGG